MSKDTDKSLFILSPLANKHAALYQQLFSGIVSIQELGNKIIREIKAAYAFRQVEKVRELSNVLINFPIREFQVIGQYYLVWCECRELKFNDRALDSIIEQAQTYKSKALISRAAIEVYKGNVESALYFYKESFKANPLVSDYIVALRGIATIKSMEGYHVVALRDLEHLLPLLRHAEPLTYFEVINSYAVELGEVGRKREARNTSRIVLASPFIHAYPEWQDTARELKEPNRSFVALVPSRFKRRNILRMPLVERDKKERISYNEPARVTNLQQWKTDMGKDKKPPENLTEQEMIYRIIHVYTSNSTTSEQRRKMHEAAERIAAMPIPPKPDPDDDGA